PSFRVDPPSRAFTNIGIDYFGPLTLNVNPPAKYYGLIIACANSRAVHLELCMAQDTEACFEALMAAFALRGVPKYIYSDNGAAFRSSNNAIKEMASIMKTFEHHDYFTSRGIQWNFNTPVSPW